ncbi:MAG: mercuric reductase [Candidatus Acidiferrales bacterium]|jgi:pyruvate/2-oxoglutarate dehydrogenase complex dihydrolipoamide dehydrogenase (E3) component
MKFEAVIIGTGQAGKPLSYALADLGWKIALIERAELGGSCINTGCTPTKTMVASAQVAHYARDAVRWGVRVSGVEVDLPAVVARKNQVVQNARTSIQKRIDARPNIKLVRGPARFIAPNQVQVGAEVFESEKIFINTGTRPAIPQIPGLNAVPFLTNATIMELQAVPEHLLVLGGGYIGLEFGQMFRRFGSRVTIIHNGERILPREDPDIASALQTALEAEGIVLRMNVETKRVENGDGAIALTVESGGSSEILQGSHLLVATGRKPNTDDMGLETAGILTGSRGYIKVNGRLETNVPGIWALGDVKGGPAFTHISYNDYQIAYANIIEGKNLTIEHRYLPYALFTDPPLGRVGITESEARASGRKFKMGTFPMSSVARAIERDETAGLMKIIVDAENDRILGAAILGSEGGETVQILGAMILAGAPYTVLKGAVYIHPTLAEGLFGLLESVKAAN